MPQLLGTPTRRDRRNTERRKIQRIMGGSEQGKTGLSACSIAIGKMHGKVLAEAYDHREGRR